MNPWTRVAGIADSGENGHCHTLVQGEGKGQKHNHSPGDVKRKNEHDCKINIRQLRIPKRSQKIFWSNTYVLDQSTFSLVFKQKSLCFACSMQNGSYTTSAQGYSSPSRPWTFEHNSTSERYQQKPDLSWHTAFQRSQKRWLADPAANDVHRVITNVVIVPIDLAEHQLWRKSWSMPRGKNMGWPSWKTSCHNVYICIYICI